MMPLDKLLARLKVLTNAKYKDSSKELGSLGQVFQDSAERNPDYFVAPRSASGRPTNDMKDLSARYGVDVQPVDIGARAGTGVRGLTPQGSAAYMLPVDVPRDLMNKAIEKGEGGEYAKWAKAVKGNQLTPFTEMFGVDMLGAAPGDAGAKQLYPALYEWLLAHPDAANHTPTGLSVNNRSRRTPAMAGALEKWGDVAGDRLRVDADQLGRLGTAGRESEYHALPTRQKIGLLNALSAQDTIEKVNSTLRSISNRAHNKEAAAAPLYDEARSLGLRDDLWTPSTDIDSDYAPRLARLLAQGRLQLPNGAPNVGVDSLRRAALTTDSLSQGLTAADLEYQPWLTKGLARKKGGLIPARTPAGPLETCGCAGSKS